MVPGKTIDGLQNPTNTEKFFSMSSISAFSAPKKDLCDKCVAMENGSTSDERTVDYKTQ